MIFYKKIFLFVVIFLYSFFLVLWESVQLNLEIKWLWIRHWTPNNINLWTIQYSTDIQEVTWRFNSWFWVEDRMWLSTWHYTTIQCDWLYASTWNVITWVYLKAWYAHPYLIMWITWLVNVSNNLLDYKSILDPLVYIYKPNHPSNLWLANKYWDMPYVKIVIPPYTTPWTYNWTIIFSLYMN